MVTTPTATNQVILAGSRSYSDYPYLRTVCDVILGSLPGEITIISGGAPGTDAMGERYAKERNYDLVTYHANWGRWGSRAGPIRNFRMAEVATHAIVFWEGKTVRSGSLHMIQTAEAKDIPVRIVLIGSAAKQKGDLICSSLAETGLG